MVFLRLLTISSVVAAFLSGIASFFLWGYAMSRPAIITDALVSPVVEWRASVSNLSSDARSTCSELDCERSRAFRMPFESEQSNYYCLDECLLPAATHGQLKTTTELDQVLPKVLVRISPMLIDDGWNETSMDSAAIWHATVVSLIDNGEPLLAVGLRSGEISGDRHVYSEFLLDGKSLDVIRHQSFFFDVAGLEGVEFSTLLVVSFPAILVVLGGFYSLQKVFWRN